MGSAGGMARHCSGGGGEARAPAGLEGPRLDKESEDFEHDRLYGTVRAVNPFLAVP